jgi:hypothetical protein
MSSARRAKFRNWPRSSFRFAAYAEQRTEHLSPEVAARSASPPGSTQWGWIAPIGWSIFNVSAWSASGLLA